MRPARRFCTTWMTIATLALAACVSHDYIGETFAPTEEVRVFFDEASVPEGYVVMGENRASTSADVDTQTIVADMVKQARRVGADAMLIIGVETVVTGTSTSTQGSAFGRDQYFVDSKGRIRYRPSSSVRWDETTYSSIERDKIVTAKFLRRTAGATE